MEEIQTTWKNFQKTNGHPVSIRACKKSFPKIKEITKFP